MLAARVPFRSNNMEIPRDEPPQTKQVQFSLIGFIALGAAIFLADWGLIQLTYQSGRIAAIWLENGIVVTALLKLPTRLWPKIFATALAANLLADGLSGDRLPTAIALSLANLIEILVATAPLRALALDRDFRDLRSVGTFLLLALGPATGISAILAGTYLMLAQSANFGIIAINWYAADALGLILVVPVGMLLELPELSALVSRDKLPLTFAYLAVIGLVLGAMAAWPHLPLGFLLFPAILLISYGRGYAGAVAGLTLIGAALLANLFLGYGFIAASAATLRVKVFFVQFFLITFNITALIVSAHLFRKNKLERNLIEATQLANAARNEACAARSEADKANEAKSLFLANMSHELRTPLNAVLGFADIIRGGILGTKYHERYPEYAEHIFQAGTHLLDLINDILDVSKIEAGEYELYLQRVDLCEVAREAIGMIEHRAIENGLALTVNAPDGPLFVPADRRAVKQIALNLLSNAVKFTPGGGMITVTIGDTGTEATFAIQDTGIGIPADFLPRLGKPFAQVRNSATLAQQGTGLGLSLVNSLVTMHKGKMKIESIESVGTTVTISLPVENKAAIAA